MYYALDERELCTVLAALTVYQDGTPKLDQGHDLPAIVDIATDGYTSKKLDPAEIDALVDRLKTCRSEQVQPIAEAYREYASEHLTDEGAVEIDDNALVSLGDDPGAYVMAWVWVDNADLPEKFRIAAEDDGEASDG